MRYSDYWIFGLIFLASCTTQGWSDVQRKSVHNMLESWGSAPAMDAIDTIVYSNAVDCAIAKIENIYPSFSKFSNDTTAPHTVSTTLIECIADNIGSQFENLRFVMPYQQLVNMGALPSGMTTAQQKAFYECLGSSASKEYSSPHRFLREITKDASKNVLEHAQMRKLIAICCEELSIPCPMIGGADTIDAASAQ